MNTEEGEESNDQRMDRGAGQLKEVIADLQPIPSDPMIEGFFVQSELLDDVKVEIGEMRRRLNEMEPQMAMLLKRTRPLRRDWLYLVIFGTAALFTVVLVARGWAQKPTVSIDFNVGDIIGGLLVGFAAVFASLSYARGRSGDAP
jgi:hypothetical protein